MEVGKKYIRNGSIKPSIFTCEYITALGNAMMSWNDISVVYNNPRRDIIIPKEQLYHYIEYREKKKGTIWVNIYPPSRVGMIGHITRSLADEQAGPSRVACIQIEWEEGQGLDDKNCVCVNMKNPRCMCSQPRY